MKVGDIVEVNDGSYSLFYDGSGELVHTNGNNLRGRRFRVLLADAVLPVDNPCLYYDSVYEPPQPNDLMLCEVAAPEHILFTRAQSCNSVARPAEVAEKAEIIVPFGTKIVVIHIPE